MTAAGFIGFIAAALVLTGPARAQTPDAEALYRQILALSADGEFPASSGPVTIDPVAHPDARSETWGITAHLKSAAGAPLTLQASFARLGLRAGDAADLDISALWRGHVILLPEEGEVRAEERISRGLGAAGWDAEAVWIDDFSLDVSTADTLALRAGGLSLTLDTGTKTNALKAEDPEVPFRGYGLPAVPATAVVDGETFVGTAWLDHLWGDVPLPGGPLAYDRLILHLDDGSAVSLIRTRRRDGQGIATLDGSLIDASGATALSDATVELSDTRLAGAGLDLTLDPAAMATPPFAVPFTTTALTATGTRNGAPVSGLGSLQVSGGSE